MLNLDLTPDSLRRLAQGYFEYDDYIKNDHGVATKILSISDMHVPFQLPIELLSEHKNSIDILQINGDVVDSQSLSKFVKLYRTSPIEEIIQGRKYLIDLINYIQPKKVVCNFGNHDERLGVYLAKNLDCDISELLPLTSLEYIFEDGFTHYNRIVGEKTFYDPLINIFESVDIQFVHDWKCKIGKTWFVHPIAYRSGTLATCEKVKDYLQDTQKDSFDCVCVAHTHAVGDSKKGFIRLLEQGAYADVTKMRYADGRLCKPQKEGYAIICQDERGCIINEKTKVVVLN